MNLQFADPGFRSLSKTELHWVSGGNGEDDSESDNVIIVEAERPSVNEGGGGSGSAALLIPLSFLTSANDGDPGGSDAFGGELTYVVDNQLTAEDQAQLADFLEPLIAGIQELIDEYGDFEVTLPNGDKITGTQLLNSLGKTFDLIEAGAIVSAAANGDPFVADTAGFLVSLGVAAGLAASAAPLTVLIASTAAGALTTLLVAAVIDKYEDNLRSGIDSFSSGLVDQFNDSMGIDPNDSLLDQMRDFLDNFGPSLPFDIQDILQREISIRESIEESVDNTGPHPQFI